MVSLSILFITIASLGHVTAHNPHPKHLSAFILAISSTVIALNLHLLKHVSHPVHNSSSIVEIKFAFAIALGLSNFVIHLNIPQQHSQQAQRIVVFVAQLSVA